jgi:hypothetical protein
VNVSWVEIWEGSLENFHGTREKGVGKFHFVTSSEIRKIYYLEVISLVMKV